MKRELSIRMLCLLLLLSVVCSCVGCGEKKEQRDSREIIEELVVDYGSYGQEAETRPTAGRTSWPFGKTRTRI